MDWPGLLQASVAVLVGLLFTAAVIAAALAMTARSDRA
jgi:hypothetical protein